MRYAIDTDVAIDYLRGGENAVSRMSEISEVYVTPATVAELFYGAYNSDQPEKRLREVFRFLEGCHLLPMDHTSCRLFGYMKALQERKGRKRGDFDLLVASVCAANGCTLITRNVRHYADLEGLSVESI